MSSSWQALVLLSVVSTLLASVVHANRHPQYALMVIYNDVKVVAIEQVLATLPTDAEVRSDWEPVRRKLATYMESQVVTHKGSIDIIDTFLNTSNTKSPGFFSAMATNFNRIAGDLYKSKMLAPRRPKAVWNLHYYALTTALTQTPDTSIEAEVKKIDPKIRNRIKLGTSGDDIIDQITTFRESVGSSNAELLEEVDKEVYNQIDVWWSDDKVRKDTPDGQVEEDGNGASSSSSSTDSSSASGESSASKGTSSSKSDGPTPTTANPINTDDKATTPTPVSTITTAGGGFKMILLVPIIGGALVVFAIAYWLGSRRNKRSGKDEASPLPYMTPPDTGVNGRRGDNHKADRSSVGGSTGTTGDSRSGQHQKSGRSYNGTGTTAVHSDDSRGMQQHGSHGSTGTTDSGLWNDSLIQAVRIPLELIEYGSLISRGGYGEVFHGRYKDQEIAIKRLLPERRRDMEQITGFMGEIKVMASMEHERIVRFIGVAWDSLAELCMITEYMSGGDLRSVVTRWEQEGRAKGFDTGKIKIALHVAHALTYMHSLQPVVLHRDLKSKNILLSRDFDAKLIDFGIARERADITMTGGVGTSRWMAPEVMLGERYDEKADIFSFGVVLSELDTHELPYANAQEPETGIRVPETAILQLVALGRLTVAFSKRANPEMVALARECIALEPRRRPTAATVLHRVHEIMLDEGFDI